MTRATLKLVASEPLTGTAELLEMLTYRRPAWSKTERGFIHRYIRPLGVHEDGIGNLSKRIGTAPVLWSCHTDTVHHSGGRQKLRTTNGIVAQDDKSSNCLGADCTAGVWLMVNMIRAGVPGLYVFHRAEEIGGVGSSFIAKHRPSALEGIKYAVAFDRRATQSIITHQGDRCCSETFSLSLSAALGMGHSSDPGGTFTDTANYTGLVGECTNVSVGYMNEHTKRETLDLGYIERLRDALLAIDTATLVAERKPGEIDPDDYHFNFDAKDPWDDEDQEPLSIGSHGATLATLLREHPDEVADWLEEYGITADEIATAIYLRGGVLRNRRSF
jgi:hypothetical protein